MPSSLFNDIIFETLLNPMSDRVLGSSSDTCSHCLISTSNSGGCIVYSVLLWLKKMSYSRPMKPGTVMAVSKNGGILAVSNEDGWTAVELLGREGEISKGDTVFARDWQETSREDLMFNGEAFSADFRGCGDEKWALGQLGK